MSYLHRRLSDAVETVFYQDHGFQFVELLLVFHPSIPYTKINGGSTVADRETGEMRKKAETTVPVPNSPIRAGLLAAGEYIVANF